MLFDIYQSKEKSILPPIKIKEYEVKLWKINNTIIDALAEFLFLSFSYDYHPTNKTWYKNEIHYNFSENYAIYHDMHFFIKHHNKNVSIGDTIENSQDNMKK